MRRIIGESDKMKNVKQGIMGSLLAFLLVFGIVSPVSAVDINTVATVPTILGMSVDKTTLNFNLASVGSYIQASEGLVSFSNTGNVGINVMGRINDDTANIKYRFDTKVDLILAIS